MNIKKNRLMIPISKSCDYCDNDWGFIMDDPLFSGTVYYDPADNTVICGPCHKEYGPADSKVEDDSEDGVILPAFTDIPAMRSKV